MAESLTSENTQDQVMTIHVGADDELLNDQSQPNDEVAHEATRLEAAACYTASITADSWRGRVLSNPEELRQELKAHTAQETSSQRFMVVHGLPKPYIIALRDELGIDTEFLRAMATRQRYKLQRAGTGGEATAVSYEYPELVESVGSQPLVVDNEKKYGGGRLSMADGINTPPHYSVSCQGDEVAFCRAILWRGGKETGKSPQALCHKDS
jgi:hypothetical protein